MAIVSLLYLTFLQASVVLALVSDMRKVLESLNPDLPYRFRDEDSLQPTDSERLFWVA